MSTLRGQRDWGGVRENNANRGLFACFYSLYRVALNSGFT